MIVFKEKQYVLPALGTIANTAMIGGTGIGILQSHNQGVEAERQAEESQRLQKRMNKELERIADSGDPQKGQQAAAVLQGQTAFSVAEDVGEDAGNGIKKAGNIVGGTAGSILGGVGGAATGAGGMALANKMAGKKMMGAGKAGLIGAGVGLIGGSVMGGASGSSIFSQKSYAAASELVKAGKGLWNVTKMHKGTIAEGLGAGVIMGGTGYLADKAIQKDKENGTDSALKKIGLGAAGAVLGGMALKKGANYKLLGDKAFRNRKAIGRAASALQIGAGFGGAMTAMPLAMQKSQESQMKSETGGQKDQGSGLGKKVLLGAGLTAGLALGGYKAAKAGWLTKGLKGKAEALGNKLEGAKESILAKSWKGQEAVEARRAIKSEANATKNPKYTNPTFFEKDAVTGKTNYGKLNKPGETILDKTTAFMGGGTQKTQKLADQLKSQDSQYLQKAGDFMKNHKKTALAAAAVPGYAAMMGTWDAGERATKKVLKSVDPNAYKNEDEDI